MKVRNKIMGYISKYDTTFLTMMNRKYSKYNVRFDYWDDYALWLYDMVKMNDAKYYKQMEKDLWAYVDFQSGRERDKVGRIKNGNEDTDK